MPLSARNHNYDDNFCDFIMKTLHCVQSDKRCHSDVAEESPIVRLRHNIHDFVHLVIIA